MHLQHNILKVNEKQSIKRSRNRDTKIKCVSVLTKLYIHWHTDIQSDFLQSFMQSQNVSIPETEKVSCHLMILLPHTRIVRE